MSATFKLLNPGPVTLTPRVRAALTRPDLCHREPEFAALQQEIRERLARVYPEAAATHRAVLLTGSGTAAVEAMVGSLVPRSGRAVVAVNGVYGERIAAMLELQGKTALQVRAPFDQPIDVDGVARVLATDEGITHVIAVQHETTTGRLNDIAALGRVCFERRVPLLVDAVSSFGAERLAFADWNLEAVAGVANKCLHGAPGVAFVLVRADTLAKATSGATSVYLDLFRHDVEQQRRSTAFTQAVPACQALCEALRELDEAGGWRTRNRRYRELSSQVFRGLARLGVAPLLPITEPSSSVLTAYRLPDRCTYSALHDALKQAGFVIYAGQGTLAADMFRIAVMGDLAAADIDRLLAACEQHLAVDPRLRMTRADATSSCA